MDWPADLAIATCRKCVDRKLPIFAHFPEFSADDLLHEALIHAQRHWHLFDPAKAAASTWIYRLASFRILDLHRQRVRRAHREAARGVVDWVDAEPIDNLPGADGGNEETIEDWTRRVYMQAKHHDPLPHQRQGRRFYTFAQEVAIALLMRKRNLSSRGAVLFFEENPSMMVALELPRVPEFKFFARAKRKLVQKIPDAKRFRDVVPANN